MSPARQARERLGMSLQTAAKKAGLKESTLALYERSGCASDHTMAQLARIYQCPMLCFCRNKSIREMYRLKKV